jgi:5-methylcytosine-specific restriction endonuclease McrA
VVLAALRVQLDPQPLRGIAGVVAFLFFLRWQGAKRSRYIPRATKRAVIKRYAEETGEKYDPKKHHIDHPWPHSRGGSNTEDNLRVVEKEKNLKKSAKRPKLRDMW